MATIDLHHVKTGLDRLDCDIARSPYIAGPRVFRVRHGDQGKFEEKIPEEIRHQLRIVVGKHPAGTSFLEGRRILSEEEGKGIIHRLLAQIEAKKSEENSVFRDRSYLYFPLRAGDRLSLLPDETPMDLEEELVTIVAEQNMVLFPAGVYNPSIEPLPQHSFDALWYDVTPKTVLQSLNQDSIPLPKVLKDILLSMDHSRLAPVTDLKELNALKTGEIVIATAEVDKKSPWVLAIRNRYTTLHDARMNMTLVENRVVPLIMSDGRTEISAMSFYPSPSDNPIPKFEVPRVKVYMDITEEGRLKILQENPYYTPMIKTSEPVREFGLRPEDYRERAPEIRWIYRLYKISSQKIA